MNFTTTSTSTNSHSGSGPKAIKYIYDLPFFDRKEVCRIFDENNQWETLGGGLMGYSTSELSEFGRAVYRGGSPTDALLTSWGNQNHTVLELFTLFGRLLHTRGMKVIAKYVDPKYHTYIRDPDFQATAELVGIDPPKGQNGHGGEQKVQNVTPDSPKAKLDPDPKKDTKDEKGKALSSLSESVGLLPQIPYFELTSATNNWDRRNMLGKGGFGTVYKGLWKNTSVAIKRMEHRANQAYVESQMKQSLGEMKFLNSYRHDNILPLYGFSLEGEHPCLVYQFMNHGSLEDRLLCRQRTPPLSWHLRFHIAKGVACGIQFLHSIGNLSLIHGDIKSANILLDRNFEAKVGDFGLAREMSQTPSEAGSAGASYVKVSRVHGTRPYLPDEYLRSKKLSTKVDTYSFGIVLFELATGLRAYEEQRQKKFLKDLVEDFDGILEKLKDSKGGGDNPDVFFILINLGRLCTEKLAKKRPEMVEVLKSLETSLPQTQASSIRTNSTNVTGLPYLFEMPLSRPGSLGIPFTSYTTNRNSPEMRAGSPHWVAQPQAQHQMQGGGIRPWEFGSAPFPGPNVNMNVRKSPQTSPPLPGQFQPIQNYQNQNPQLPSPGGAPLVPGTHLFEQMHNNNLHHLQNFQNIIQNPSPTPPTNTNSNSNNQTQIPSSLTSTSSNKSLNVNLMGLNLNPLVIDTSGSRPVPPELLLIEPSPVATPTPTPPPLLHQPSLLVSDNLPKIPKPIVPVSTELLVGQGSMEPPKSPLPLLEEDEELYLPLVLEEHSSSKSDPSESTYTDGPATAIPLITELGIKD